DDRQSGQRAGTVLVVELGRALEPPGVQVEHAARIGSAARRAAKQQRHLAGDDGLLGKVVADDHRVHAVVAEELAHGRAGIGRQVLQRSGLGRGRGDDDRVLHRAVLFELADDLRDSRTLLTDGHVDAVELLRFVSAGVDFLLVDEGVDRDGRLAGLAVADDQFALTAADRHQSINRFEAGLHGLVHRLARDDARSLDLDTAALGGHDGSLAVDRIAERVDHTAEQTLADRNVHDRAGTLDAVAFPDLGVGAEDHDADVVSFEVERHALNAVGELDHLAGLNLVEAVDARDAVTYGKHAADFRDLGLGAEVGDL